MVRKWDKRFIKDSNQTAMKSLPEAVRTIQIFLKIARDEEELQEDRSEREQGQPCLPYITNTVSTTMKQIRNDTDKTVTFERPQS